MAETMTVIITMGITISILIQSMVLPNAALRNSAGLYSTVTIVAQQSKVQLSPGLGRKGDPYRETK